MYEFNDKFNIIKGTLNWFYIIYLSQDVAVNTVVRWFLCCRRKLSEEHKNNPDDVLGLHSKLSVQAGMWRVKMRVGSGELWQIVILHCILVRIKNICTSQSIVRSAAETRCSTPLITNIKQKMKDCVTTFNPPLCMWDLVPALCLLPVASAVSRTNLQEQPDKTACYRILKVKDHKHILPLDLFDKYHKWVSVRESSC